MPYDPALPKVRTPRRFSPFDPASTPWRAEQLAFLTAGTAGYLVFSHLFSMLFNTGKPLFLALNLLGAVTAAAMCFVAYRRQPIWVAVVVLVWSALECALPLTRQLYGHFTILQGAAMTFVLSIGGLRGAIALRGFEKRGEFDRNKSKTQKPLALSTF